MLYCAHITTAIFVIICLELCSTAMLDFICKGFAECEELGGTGCIYLIHILVKISKLPLDFVNRKCCCGQLYRIVISLT